MLKIKKTLSILLVAVLMMGMSVSAFADEAKSVTTNDSLMEEYDELISAMVKAASNVKVIGDRTIYIPVQSGRLNGTVTIKEEPVGEQKLEVGSRASHVYSKIPLTIRVVNEAELLGQSTILLKYYREV